MKRKISALLLAAMLLSLLSGCDRRATLPTEIELKVASTTITVGEMVEVTPVYSGANITPATKIVCLSDNGDVALFSLHTTVDKFFLTAINPGTCTITLDYVIETDGATWDKHIEDDDMVLIKTATLIITVIPANDDEQPLPEGPALQIKTKPAHTVYYPGSELDLTGLVLTFRQDKTAQAVDIPLSDFEQSGITASVANGAAINESVDILFTHTASGAVATLPIVAGKAPSLTTSVSYVGNEKVQIYVNTNDEPCTVQIRIAPAGTPTPAQHLFNTVDTVSRFIHSNITREEITLQYLQPGTNYVAFVQVINSAGIWPAKVARLEFTTQGTAPAPTPPSPPAPGNIVLTPGIVLPSAKRLNVSATADLSCTIYIMPVQAGSAAPTASDVKAWANAWSSGVAQSNYTQGDPQASMEVSDLPMAWGGTCDLYMYAENATAISSVILVGSGYSIM